MSKNCQHHSNLLHTHAQCVRLVPIFNHLDDESMDRIGSYASTMSFKRGEMIYRAQEEDDTLYIVNRGQVKIYRLTEGGKEQLVRILNPGDFTGEWTIFDTNNQHEDYAEALKDTSICTLRNKDVQAILRDYPAISMKFLAEMSQRLARSERQTSQVATGQIGSRLMMFLADLVEDSEPGPKAITLPMTRKEIASYLGTTPESISRKFRELEEKGLIQQQTGKKIIISDLDDLLLYGED